MTSFFFKSSKIFLIVATFFCGLTFGDAWAHAGSVYDAHTSVELIAEKESIDPGEIFSAGVLFKMDPDWHVYWKNPGDSGMAPRVEWVLPEGLKAGEIRWPVPQKIDLPPLTSYGYEGQVLLAAPLVADASFDPDAPVTLKAKVEWLACKVECVPGRAELEIRAPFEARAPLFKEASNLYPRAELPWKLTAWRFEKKAVLLFSSRTTNSVDFPPSYFFAENEALVSHAQNQSGVRRGNSYELEIPLAANAPRNLQRLRGVLIGRGNTGTVLSWEVDAPFGDADVLPAQSLRFYSAVLFAFLGGLILNLMPCVLPVLSLKILSFVNQPEQKRAGLRGKGLVFTAGVLTSFWILAGALIFLRAAGDQIGWGFQLQSPVFVAVLAGVFFLLALNLFGFFEIGASWSGAGQSWVECGGWKGSFAGGVLAVIVAAPCTAPFMGAALAFALSQPPAEAFAVFTFLGLGLSAPYLILCFYPGWLRLLPKPGPWMLKLKKVFGIFLLLTAFWLVWILSVQTGITKKISYSVEPAQNKISWEPYSGARLAALRSADKPVFIDFTAAWCLTCQWNKRTALNHASVVKVFKEKKIHALQADWTAHDPAITRALQEYGRNSIPFYVFYPASPGEPVFLPELLTPEILKRYLD